MLLVECKCLFFCIKDNYWSEFLGPEICIYIRKTTTQQRDDAILLKFYNRLKYLSSQQTKWCSNPFSNQCFVSFGIEMEHWSLL